MRNVETLIQLENYIQIVIAFTFQLHTAEPYFVTDILDSFTNFDTKNTWHK